MSPLFIVKPTLRRKEALMLYHFRLQEAYRAIY